ncbi:hypothetical protein [Hymenobacter agri]
MKRADTGANDAMARLRQLPFVLALKIPGNNAERRSKAEFVTGKAAEASTGFAQVLTNSNIRFCQKSRESVN